MNKVILIHTVQSVLQSFDKEIRKAVPGELQIDNMLDEFLANEANRSGVFSIENFNRFFYLLKCAELACPDLVVVTCSTLSPYVVKLRELISVPIIAIDDAMSRAVVAVCANVKILATAESALRPTLDKLQAEAGEQKRALHFELQYVPEAIARLKAGDQETHDRILLEEASRIRGCDGIVLAQASMAHMGLLIEQATGITCFSSPSYCLNEIRGFFANKGAVHE